MVLNVTYWQAGFNVKQTPVLDLPDGKSLTSGLTEETYFSWDFFQVTRPDSQTKKNSEEKPEKKENSEKKGKEVLEISEEQAAALAGLRKGLANLAAQGHPTPRGAIIQAFDEIDLTGSDKVLDIGCGDGRALVEAVRLKGARGVGYEIDETIAETAREAVKEAGYADKIDIHCQNAMEVIDSVLADGITVVFMYLQGHGLRKVLPYLRKNPTPLRVVTYHYQFLKLTELEEPRKVPFPHRVCPKPLALTLI